MSAQSLMTHRKAAIKKFLDNRTIVLYTVAMKEKRTLIKCNGTGKVKTQFSLTTVALIFISWTPFDEPSDTNHMPIPLIN
jgi:hypothetical protein